MMGSKSSTKGTHQGNALIIVIILLLVAAGIGIWGLKSTRDLALFGGFRKGSTSLELQAQEALQLAVDRIRRIANADGDPNMSDPVGSRNLKSLVDDICDPSDGSVSTCNTPACPEAFDPAQNFDAVYQSSNVVCNFMGDRSSAQVILVRKPDLPRDPDQGEIHDYGVFLINVIARGTSGGRHIHQGVVIVPYLVQEGNYIATEPPYLSTSQALK